MRILSKRSGLIAAIGLSLGLVATATIAYAAATFGPSRPTFTWANPASYITFNSITDNPNWPGGDERYFVKSRDVSASPSTYTNQAQVTDGEELVVVAYFHNNAETVLNLHAKNTSLGFNLPSGTATDQSIKSTISASNANPTSVFSTMDMTMGGSPFTVDYVPGSATIHTGYFDSALSDNVVKGGVTIGSKALDGDVPGCFQFSGYVYIHVKVHKVTPPTPVYSCNLLSLTQDASNIHKYKGSVTFTATNGASLTNVNWAWGDGASDNTGITTTNSHTYAKDGTYTVKATLTFNVNGETKTATSESCSKTITITTPPTTPPPTTPPAQLPNTGAGSVVGIFAGVSALAGAAHYFLSGRRNPFRG